MTHGSSGHEMGSRYRRAGFSWLAVVATTTVLGGYAGFQQHSRTDGIGPTAKGVERPYMAEASEDDECYRDEAAAPDTELAQETHSTEQIASHNEDEDSMWKAVCCKDLIGVCDWYPFKACPEGTTKVECPCVWGAMSGSEG